MQIKDDLWKNTKIGGALSFFPGILGEFLQQATPAEAIRAEKFLAHIFWRWYFLEGIYEKIAPYDHLLWRKEVEGWPKQGQFFPKPSIVTKMQEGKPVIKIDIEVDYISFNEQPLLIDIEKCLAGEDLLYKYDARYQEDIKALMPLVQPFDPLSTMTTYLVFTLNNWHQNDQFALQCFSQNEWLSFWRRLFSKMQSKDGLGTDEILDAFVAKVRQVFPGYGLSSNELKNYSLEKSPKIKFEVQHAFWVMFALYFLLPLSLYTHLLAPLYVDQNLFHDDVEELLKNYYNDPMPLLAPCTAVSLTGFGDKVLANWEEAHVI